MIARLRMGDRVGEFPRALLDPARSGRCSTTRKRISIGLKVVGLTPSGRTEPAFPPGLAISGGHMVRPRILAFTSRRWSPCQDDRMGV